MPLLLVPSAPVILSFLLSLVAVWFSLVLFMVSFVS
jgi:hypothetical protein